MAVDAPLPVGLLNPQFLAGAGTGIKRSRDLLTDDSSEQISLMIKQQQIEIDSIIVQHARRLRIEIEGRRIQQTRMLISSVREGICRKMHDKEEEIKRIGRNTLFLQDKLKILCFENQSLRDLALTNEAAAISLRRSLAETLASISGERLTAAEQVASCCYDNHDDDDDKDGYGDGDGDLDKDGYGGGDNGGGVLEKYKCRHCGEREASVLLLPCRHLCQCIICGSTLISTCPVCNSQTNASIRVNIS